MIYVFDGSFEGLLSAVFEYFERKPQQVVLSNQIAYQPDAFTAALRIPSNRTKADRVWKGLQQKLDKSWLRKIYCGYLAEQAEAHQALFNLIIYIFNNPNGAQTNYGNPHVLGIAQIAKKVEREKHRMEAFIRFKHTSDGIFYCGIDPDFNVLPLIATHFKNRYADQRWVIYDLKRKYGLFYDLHELTEITMDLNPQGLNQPTAHAFNMEEERFAQLWKTYFKSTNIVSRKNTKLHVQHVPKRYWKYLTEKQAEWPKP